MTNNEFAQKAHATLDEFIAECRADPKEHDEREWWWWNLLATWLNKPPDMGPFDGNQD